jgi:NAD(P)-dependent dehydrogenase (short-subunit alcohol dehydrogenase family)
MNPDKPLEGKIAVVAGATRGAGRGIASMLGEAGATVYCTGRSTRGKSAMPGRPESIEETAEMVTARGGQGIHVQVDHLEPEQVRCLFQRVEVEQGRLDILVNDIWGADPLVDWGKPFWDVPIENGFKIWEQGVSSHLITNHFGVPLMIQQKKGLIVEITDGNHQTNRVYRGHLFYDLAKSSVMRVAFGMAEELKPHSITVLALTPGFLRSEAMLDHFGVQESNWRDAVEQDPHFIASETPFFIGRAVAALAADPEVHRKAGQALSTWELAREYKFRDIDGSRPDWEAHAAKYFPEMF